MNPYTTLDSPNTKTGVWKNFVFPVMLIFLTFGCFILFLSVNSLKKDIELNGKYRDRDSCLIQELIRENDSLKGVIGNENFLHSKLKKETGINKIPRIPQDHLNQIFLSCKEENVPVQILGRIIYYESRFNPQARNASGANGYCQMMPGTYKSISKKLGIKTPQTPITNIQCGAALLSGGFDYWKEKKDSVGAWEMALSCYLLGDSLPRALGKVPSSARSYVNKIMK